MDGRKKTETKKKDSCAQSNGSSKPAVLSNDVRDKMWSLEMQNHPSWNILTNLVENYLQKENGVQKTTPSKVSETATGDSNVDEFERKYKKYKTQYKKCKHKLRKRMNGSKTKDFSTKE